MRVLSALWNLLVAATSSEDGIFPIMDKAYLNDVEMILTPDPLILSDDFGDFTTMFGLVPFEGFIDALASGASPRTLYYPDISKTKKPNGHDPLGIHLSFHEESPLALFSLFGPDTEIHAVIKAPKEKGMLQLDHLCIIDGDTLYDIPCGKNDGDVAILRKMIACFADAVGHIIKDKQSINIDAELQLWRGIKPLIEALETLHLQKSDDFTTGSAILPPSCG